MATTIADAAAFKAAMDKGATDSSTTILFFWADWHAPSKQMKAVVDELAKDTPAITFLAIEAEKVPEACTDYPIKSVPTFAVVRGSKTVDHLEGASAPKLVQLVGKHAKTAAAAAPAVKESKESINARLTKLVNAAPVMLFMKGDPDAPRCGFSRTMISLLKEEGVKFGYFDILTNDEVRQGLKEFSNWPTYPQLYIKGELVGGLDVVKEMIEEGELKALVPEGSTEEDLNTRLKGLVSQKRVMLFMKGSPDAPQCGFSRKMVGLLREAGIEEYGHFDILTDQEVRQGLKTFSNWPTYPQLYVDGELQGGLDVCQEMMENGDLADIAFKLNQTE